jgi:hypothetical protein
VLYLLDANVLITAHNNYYPLNRVPEFWDWLLHHAEQGQVTMPLEIFEEVREGTGDAEKDVLFGWLQRIEVRRALVLEEEVSPQDVQRVIDNGYAADLNDVELDRVGRDPFLIAYALRAPHERCVVSNESSSPNRQRANRKIPDVCRALGTSSCNTFALLKTLDFTTQWRR